jgi:hypothetical protein
LENDCGKFLEDLKKIWVHDREFRVCSYMCIQRERTIITYVIANFGRENLSPSSEEQMKRNQYAWKKALWPKIM